MKEEKNRRYPLIPQLNIQQLSISFYRSHEACIYNECRRRTTSRIS